MGRKDSYEPNDLQLNLTLTEVHALHKTVGIAIDNLNTKIARNGSQAGKFVDGATSDLRALLSVQQEILALLEEVS